jgi:hypothetical protein
MKWKNLFESRRFVIAEPFVEYISEYKENAQLVLEIIKIDT